MVREPGFRPADLEPRVQRPEPDGAGGAQLTGVPDRALRVEGPSLQALDLHDAPELERLDLRACRPGLFLALARCPRLHRIELPEGAAGAIVHWDRHGAVAGEAELEGPIAHLDLCGPGYAFGLPGGAADPRPWRGARLTGSPERLASAGEEALIGLGPAVDAAAPPLRLPATARSVVLHGVGVAALEAGAASALAYLAIDRAPALRRLAVAGRIQALSLARCERLATVQAAGEALQLKHCGATAPGVRLDGHWDHALLEATALDEASDVRLEHGHARGGAASAQAVARGRLRTVGPECRHELAPGEVPLILEAAQAGEPEARAVLIDWAQAVPRRHARHALQTLYELLDTPVGAPAPLWSAREALAKRLRSRAARADEPWRWDLPEDLLEEALVMDFRLFARCRGQAEGPQRLEVLLRNSPRSRELRLLALVAADRRVPEAERALAAALLREALGVAAQGLVARTPRPPADMGPVVRWIVGQSDRAMADDLVAWLGEALPARRRVPYLAELAAHGHAASRAAAMAIGLEASASQRGGARRQAVRQRAMAAALSPPRSQRLAEPGPDEEAAP